MKRMHIHVAVEDLNDSIRFYSAMFGNAPRALWSRWVVPDELGRIPLSCRAFLVEDGARRVLIESTRKSCTAPARHTPITIQSRPGR